MSAIGGQGLKKHTLLLFPEVARRSRSLLRKSRQAAAFKIILTESAGRQQAEHVAVDRVARAAVGGRLREAVARHGPKVACDHPILCQDRGAARDGAVDQRHRRRVACVCVCCWCCCVEGVGVEGNDWNQRESGGRSENVRSHPQRSAVFVACCLRSGVIVVAVPRPAPGFFLPRLHTRPCERDAHTYTQPISPTYASM